MTSDPASTVVATREITFGQAVREALAEEMRLDPTVFIIGVDVAEAGSRFKEPAGLGQPRTGAKGRPAVNALRCQGTLEDGDPRRQPRRHLRGQVDVPAERAGA